MRSAMELGAGASVGRGWGLEAADRGEVGINRRTVDRLLEAPEINRAWERVLAFDVR